MANVTTDIPASAYLDPQTVHLILSDQVEYVSLTTNAAQPTLSEYIAYDTLVPPNPFIAVTQDGKGRVVYDGGFPKFYNTVAPAAGTPFASLPASFKYLYNAINWTADPVKVAAGNKKILILGDAPTTVNYAVKGVTPNDFNISLSRLCAIVGFTATFKDINDYAGVLNPTLAELNGYACVLLLSSNSPNPAALITDGAVQDLQTFRSNGGGIIVITDHGPDITSVGGAYPPPPGGQFFATANKLVVNFGAYFTGNYDRTPVNVGFLRTNYGDHPLYNGMLNTESIAAGASESKLVVATYPTYTQATVPPIPMTSGRYIVQVLARLLDGTVETYRFVFSIADGDVVVFQNGSGVSIKALDVGFYDKATLIPKILGTGLGTLGGKVSKNGAQIATLAFTEAGGSVVVWADGKGGVVKVNQGDVFRAEVNSPFSVFSDLTITRFQPKVSGGSLAAVTQGLAPKFPRTAAKTPLQLAFDEMARLYPAQGYAYSVNAARNVRTLLDYLSDT